MNEVERVFRQLVTALSEAAPDRLRSPIEISEIYQNIIPYRRYRGTLRFDTNQDYEMALLRLLAGEGGLVRVDPPEAQEALNKEARAINPNPGAFREFAASKVYLNTRAVSALSRQDTAYAPPPPPPVMAPRPEDGGQALDISRAPTVQVPPDESGAQPPAPDAEAPSQPPVGAITFEQVTTPLPGTVDIQACWRCDKTLPRGVPVQFCPFCGVTVSRTTCARCGNEVEAEWRFCISCGKARESNHDG